MKRLQKFAIASLASLALSSTACELPSVDLANNYRCQSLGSRVIRLFEGDENIGRKIFDGSAIEYRFENRFKSVDDEQKRIDLLRKCQKELGNKYNIPKFKYRF